MKSFVDVKCLLDILAFNKAQIVSIGLASGDCHGQSNVTIWFPLRRESDPDKCLTAVSNHDFFAVKHLRLL